MTNQEIKDTGLLIRNEQHIGGNTALRVGGVIEGIGDALNNKDAANGYYQATINGGSISVNAPNYVLGTGGNLRLKMPAAGTIASTLTIGNANAVQLWYNGAAVSEQNTWEQGEIISVFYDGTRFMASNSQGGGGKAEKIKYNNSASGLDATNVQAALDEIKGEITEQLYIIKNNLTRTILAGYINPQSKFTQYNGFYVNRYPVSGLRQIIVEVSQFTEPPMTTSYFAYVFWADYQGTSNITTRVFFHNNTKFILDVPQGANYFAITSKVTVSGVVYGNEDVVTVSNFDTVKETVEEMYSTIYEGQTTDFPYILQYKEIKNGYPYYTDGHFVSYSDSTIQTAFYDVSELSSIKINYTNLRADNLACAFYYADKTTSVTGTQLHFSNGAEFDVPSGAVYFGLLFRFNDNANIDVFTITANKNNGIIPNIEDLKQTQSLYNMLFDWTTYTWMLIGDSLTEANYRAETQYYEYIADKTGINWVNKARSGMGYAISDYFYNAINGITEDFSFATIWGSANDVRYESVSSLSNYPTWLDALGNVDDNGTSSICGYINRAIDKYYDKFPLKKIGIITPVPVKNMSANGVTLTDEETRYRVETYTEKLVTIAKNRGIPCLDMLHCSGLRPWNEAYRIEYYNENGVQDNGVHPNSKGHKLFANMVLDYLFQFMVE